MTKELCCHVVTARVAAASITHTAAVDSAKLQAISTIISRMGAKLLRILRRAWRWLLTKGAKAIGGWILLEAHYFFAKVCYLSPRPLIRTR
jgi:hypothetical protein